MKKAKTKKRLFSKEGLKKIKAGIKDNAKLNFAYSVYCFRIRAQRSIFDCKSQKRDLYCEIQPLKESKANNQNTC